MNEARFILRLRAYHVGLIVATFKKAARELGYIVT